MADDTAPPVAECGSCRFYYQIRSICRRHAPQPGGSDYTVCWPIVDIQDWCGEYEAR